MLDKVTGGFSAILSKVRGYSRITEEQVAETCGLIRDTLIDADVALEVVESFVGTIQEEARGQKVLRSLNPAQVITALVQTELTKLLGEEGAPLAKAKNEPVVIMLCGLQGAGKTTTAAKLGALLAKDRKRVLLASTDVRRPAAIEQLRILCTENKLPFHEPAKDEDKANPLQRAVQAQAEASQSLADYLLLDTAGRSTIDAELMAELAEQAKATKPTEALLVIDASLGQKSLEVARGFGGQLQLTGICLTKLDGDARGGAAISARTVLGVPIKYIGTGEKIADLQSFNPKRMAMRILGMGDIASLVEQTTAGMGKAKTERLDRKLRRVKSRGLELGDMIDQIRQAQKMGGLEKIAEHLPTQMQGRIKANSPSPKIFAHMEAVYLSMTRFERSNPQLLKASRKARIAAGAGVEVATVNRLLKQHAQASKLMKTAAKNPAAAMNAMRGMLG